MKNFVTVITCLLIVITVRVKANLSQILENLTEHEKSNAVIYIECEESADGKENLIEESWNTGNYEEAIGFLKNSTELEDAPICIEWKEPVRTSQRWGGDVRIGVDDSITHTALDMDDLTGNLYAVLRYDESATGSQCAKGYMSSDTGRTWVARFTLSSSIATIFDIDVAVLGNYFYFAYSISSASNNVRICRFNTSNGIYDSDYGHVTVINEGPVIREISLTSSIDYRPLSLAEPTTNQFLFCHAIMDNDSLKYYYSDTAATVWYQYPYSNTGNADRGLDACYTEPGESWVSYIGTNDSLYVMQKEMMSWVHYGPLAYVGSNSAYVTSIGAYGDTVIVVYPFETAGPSYYVRYHITYDGGAGWYVGAIYSSSSDRSFVNDVTARNGDGIGVFYQTTGYAAEGVYRHRGYYSSWIDPDSIADNVPRQDVKPSIERIADGIYGILYVNSPEEMAWFDRSDWIEGGIEVTGENTASVLSATQSVGSSQIDINYYLPAGQRDMSLDIYDIAGKHIKNLAKGMPSGNHSVTWFGDSKGKSSPSGVYFAVLKYGELKERLKITLIR